MSQGTASFALEGGMDLVTPAIKMPPGRVIASLNYEPVSSGYQRLTGYERFDGRAAPSDATYWRVNYTLGGFGTGDTPSVGDILYHGSPAHFIIVAIVTTSGSWTAGTAAGYMIATNYIGTIAPADLLSNVATAGPNVATAGTITLEYDFGTTLNATYLAGATTQTRAKIQAVSGSGAVRGIWGFNGDILAIRDNAGATSGILFKATTSGWTAVLLLTKIPFTCDTATQTLPTNLLAKLGSGVANASVSTSDGTIRLVVISSTVGTVNTGYFLVSSYVAAQFTAAGQTIYLAGAATVLGTTTAAASATAALPAGGRYFFMNQNFYGAHDLAAAYMVNGVGPALSYDGIGLSAISTGMTTDTPNRLAAHKNALFLSFPGGSVQFSGVGAPSVFNAIVGAGEIGVGSDVADMISANKSTLAILAEESISVLYGNDSSDYQLEVLTDEAGALPCTAQRLGNVLYMDNVGLRTLAASAAFGNFSLGALSTLIEPLLRDYRRDGVDPVASLVWRRKNQYWVFFDNGTAIVAYMGRKQPEIMPVNLGFTVTCASSFEDSTGLERAFVGTSTGYVMELDKGTSFDGAVIEHYFRLPFNSFGSPEVDKRAFKAELQLEATGTTTLSMAVDFDYGAVAGLDAEVLTVTTGGGALDDLGSNELYYASQIETLASRYVDGVARNFSLKVSGSTSNEQPHVATGVTYHLTARRLVR